MSGPTWTPELVEACAYAQAGRLAAEELCPDMGAYALPEAVRVRADELLGKIAPSLLARKDRRIAAIEAGTAFILENGPLAELVSRVSHAPERAQGYPPGRNLYVIDTEKPGASEFLEFAKATGLKAVGK